MNPRSYRVRRVDGEDEASEESRFDSVDEAVEWAPTHAAQLDWPEGSWELVALPSDERVWRPGEPAPEEPSGDA